jgi:hypothetical protein
METVFFHGFFNYFINTHIIHYFTHNLQLDHTLCYRIFIIHTPYGTTSQFFVQPLPSNYVLQLPSSKTIFPSPKLTFTLGPARTRTSSTYKNLTVSPCNQQVRIPSKFHSLLPVLHETNSVV